MNLLKKSDAKLLENYKHLYKLVKTPYKQVSRLGIERLNVRYGYYNFIGYIDSEDQFIGVVLADIKTLPSNQKKGNYGYQVQN